MTRLTLRGSLYVLSDSLKLPSSRTQLNTQCLAPNTRQVNHGLPGVREKQLLSIQRVGCNSFLSVHPDKPVDKNLCFSRLY